MPRTNLNKGLQELQTLIAQLGSDLKETLAQTLLSIANGEQQQLYQIMSDNTKITLLCTEAEKRALRLLILQQPLGGQDLRFLTATLYISDHLGSIENAIVQIAHSLIQATSLYHQTAANTSLYSIEGNSVDLQGNLTDVIILRGLLSLGKEIEHILSTMMEAFAKRDSMLAQTIQAENLVTLRYEPICQDIIKMQTHNSASQVMPNDATYVQRITCLLWIAHKLAEIATHVTNICKRITFIVEG